MADSAEITVEKLMSVIAELTETVSEQNATIASFQTTVASLQETVQSLKEENSLLMEENKYLKRKLFGPKSEKASSVSSQQLSFFDEAEKECEKELLEEITYTRSKARHKGEIKLKLDELDHVKELYDVEEKDRVCDLCGSKLYKVGEELIRQEVVYEPAKLYVRDIYRNTYECRKCRKKGKVFMLKAATPKPVIPHSYASASAAAQIITDKYVNHMPLYRQEAEWKRLGLALSRTTMANWIIIASKEYFIPLVSRMHEMLLEESHIHCDETTVQVLNEPGKKAESKSYMWVYASIKESEHPIRIFEYRPDRSASNPQKFLEGFGGTIITDGYYGYNHIEGITNAYCWAHVRRKFYDALPTDLKGETDTLAHKALKKIAYLFAIEKEINEDPPDEKARVRQEKSKPLLDDFFSWCRNCENKVLTRSKIGKAIAYALNYEKGLRVYIDDGLIPMTNSLDERAIRPFTVGRKNWLFSASTEGAEASAAVFSLVETAKANHFDPHDYIEYLLEIMPNIDFVKHPERMDDFMPWSDQTRSEFEIL